MKPFRTIVVGTDFSEATAPVVRGALMVAKAFMATIDMVHVRSAFPYTLTGGEIPSPQQHEIMMNWIDDALARLRTQITDAGVNCLTSSLEGSPASTLVAHAQKIGADLIIVGTHGRTGIGHAVLGSVAERVVQKAGRPVLVLPCDS